MNKSAIQKFAVWARRELIEQVSQRAYQYGVTAQGYGSPEDPVINGRVLSDDEKKQRKELIRQIQSKGYDQVMEEVAYTWFNRFIALRFMEVNNYLPTHIRVFSDVNGNFKPEILSAALSIDLPGLDRDKVIRYIDGNQEDDLYRYLLLTQCNALNEPLPLMFEKMGSYTELLLPNNILREDGVIGRMVSDIPEDDWTDQVQIIGWLYQYYISEKHEEVVNVIKGKAIKKEDIPAATQLFTTDWVVRYMVDNSLGRYWIERHPQSKLRDRLEFFVMPKSGSLSYIQEDVKPQELTFFDPCMGSGHILVYAFDVLMEIYKECGFSERDAAAEIVENNLFGLDIDDRCSQLAYFAVMMKARSYDRRFLSRGIKPHVMAIQESNSINGETYKKFVGDEKQRQIYEYLTKTFRDAKEIGTLQTAEPKQYDLFLNYLDECEQNAQIDMDFAEWQNIEKPLLEQLAGQADIMSRKYKAVCTNPPYLNKMEGTLKAFVTSNYKEYSGDLFSVFMYRNFGYCEADGYSGFMTPNVWMFIKSYENLRNFICNSKSIVTLVQMAQGAFYKEAGVNICSFILENRKNNNVGLYIRLEEFKGDMELQCEKLLEALNCKQCNFFYETNQSQFRKVNGTPIAYWASKNIIKIFSVGQELKREGDTRQGMATSDNNRFLRIWHEVMYKKIGLGCKDSIDAKKSRKKWYPYNKGGEFRKWYGNFEYVLNYENDGEEVKKYAEKLYKTPSRTIKSMSKYFNECISWSKISGEKTSFRYYPNGFVFDVAGCCIFYSEDIKQFYDLGILNSIVSKSILYIMSPTLNSEAGQIAKFPIIRNSDDEYSAYRYVKKNISISKTDWDSYETSWDFKKHPMV